MGSPWHVSLHLLTQDRHFALVGPQMSFAGGWLDVCIAHPGSQYMVIRHCVGSRRHLSPHFFTQAWHFALAGAQVPLSRGGGGGGGLDVCCAHFGPHRRVARHWVGSRRQGSTHLL